MEIHEQHPDAPGPGGCADTGLLAASGCTINKRFDQNTMKPTMKPSHPRKTIIAASLTAGVSWPAFWSWD